MCKYIKNKFFQSAPAWKNTACAAFTNTDILSFHQSLQGYKPTPLVALPNLAKKLGIKNIFVKDESHRFGINAFKALGASYAIFQFLKKQWEAKFSTPFTFDIFKNKEQLAKLGSFTFCAATDGNHGRAVAWTANRLSQKSVIYMPDNTANTRIENIQAENSQVVLVPGTFDDCVERAAKDAEMNGWQVISDTAYPGYMEFPNYIMAGYSTIFHEANQQLMGIGNPTIDIAFLQSGVGGLAAAGTWFFTSRYKGKKPLLVSVEPTESDCFLESALNGNGEARAAKGNQMSIMAGLNCGMPSLVAWPIIRDAMEYFIAITDKYAEDAMRAYYHSNGDPRIISGESGASGLAGLLAVVHSKSLINLKNELNLNPETQVFIVNTEGDTDPVNFKKVVGIM